MPVLSNRVPESHQFAVLNLSKELVFVENSNPISGKKITWYDDPKLQSLGVNLR